MSETVLTLSDVRKAYGDHPVLKGVGFTVREREILAILGRSGCGKTTLLKIVAGLVEADHGEILVRGADVGSNRRAGRTIVYIYQEPLLFPHLDVFENVAFGLRMRKLGEQEVRERTERTLESLELTGYAARMPGQLSGGQRQRVAFGRAIIVNPDVLLLDEPFSNLDVETRANMQTLFQRIAHEHRIASVFVTHDLKEAIILGDNIAYMHDGSLTTFGSKEEFIAHPEYGARREIEFWRSLERPD